MTGLDGIRKEINPSDNVFYFTKGNADIETVINANPGLTLYY